MAKRKIEAGFCYPKAALPNNTGRLSFHLGFGLDFIWIEGVNFW
jgi:hypothetical protein